MLINEQFIARLKNQADIKQVIEIVAGITLKSEGSGFTACCPFHSEKTPSFKVNANIGAFHCFGCSEKGNVFQFVEKYNGVTFPEAVRQVAELNNIAVEYDIDENKKYGTSRVSELLTAQRWASLVFHKQLKKNPEVFDYLHKKRRFSGKTLADFRIGYAPDQWQFITNMTKKHTDLFIEAGLIKNSKNSGKAFDFFRNRVMFPIMHHKGGGIVGFGGRTLDDNEKLKYLNSGDSLTFHKNENIFGLYQSLKADRNPSEFIVMEGYTDVMTAHQAGYTQAVGVMGATMNEKQLRILHSYSDHIKLCFDGDEAGIQAALSTMHTCLPYLSGRKTIDFVILPKKLDPDQVINNYGVSKFNVALDTAISLSHMLIYGAKLDTGYQEPSLRNDINLAESLKDKVSLMPDSLQRDIVIKHCANELGVEQSLLNMRLQNNNEVIQNHIRGGQQSCKKKISGIAV